MKKKVLAIILTVALVISIFPMTILANSGDTNYKFKVGEQEYTATVRAWENGTVTFEANGTTGYIYATPNDGYNLMSLTVTTQDEETIEIMSSPLEKYDSIHNRYLFPLPKKNITIEAEFGQFNVDKYIEIKWHGDGSVKNASELSSTDIENGIKLKIPKCTTFPEIVSFKVIPSDDCSVSIDDSRAGIQGLTYSIYPKAMSFKDIDTLSVNINFNKETNPAVINKINETYNKVTKDGKIYLDTVEDIDEYLIGDYLYGKWMNEDWFKWGYCQASYDGDNKLGITLDNIKYYKNVELVYKTGDPTVKSEVTKIKEKLLNVAKSTAGKKLFEISDMELINYLFNGYPKAVEGLEYTYSMWDDALKFSSEFRELADNSNVGVKIDMRAGSGNCFCSMAFGMTILSHRGLIYDIFGTTEEDQIGVEGYNIIYVPDNTEENITSYVDTAKARIKEYLGKDVSIVAKGEFSKFVDSYTYEIMMNIVGNDRMIDQYYEVTIGDRTYLFLIVANSSKMKKPGLITKDIKTNATIKTDASEVPLDSNIEISEIDENSKEYKDILSKIGLSEGEMYDVSLKSTSANGYIKKLSNGLFEVSIPVDEKYEGKTVKAYYVKDDGSVETHDAKVKDGFAVFTTDHFSVYTIGLANDVPKTADGNMTALFEMLLVLSLIGAVYILKKHEIFS